MATDQDRAEWNPAFAGVVLDLGLGIEAGPMPRNKKGRSRSVGWVKGSFFKQRRFLDDEDLPRHLRLTEAHALVAISDPGGARRVLLARTADDRDPAFLVP